jgi:hypothetical protein
LKAIEDGKYGHYQKCERDEVVVKSYLLREDDTAVEPVKIINLCSNRTAKARTWR